MAKTPDSVEVVLEPREIPDERVEAWKDDWEDETLKSLHEKYNDPPATESDYLELRAEEWTQQTFQSAQGHNDLHLWVDGYEVNF